MDILQINYLVTKLNPLKKPFVTFYKDGYSLCTNFIVSKEMF